MSETDPATRPGLDAAAAKALQMHATDAARLMKALGNEHRLLILCGLAGSELSVGELNQLDERLTAFERRVSDDRRERYDRLDALSAELVRRYREGEASVDGLLGS